MSKITQISVYTHCNDIGGKVWNPAIKWIQKFAVFVEIKDEDGYSGIGECWCFDTAPDALVAFLRTEVLPQFLGIEVDIGFRLIPEAATRATLTARHGILASALSGIDIALWDLCSKRAQKPLWAFLQAELVSDGQEQKQAQGRGQRAKPARGEVYLYGSGGLYGEGKNTDDLVAEMRRMCRFPFDLVKMKVGALSVDEDIQRVRAVLNGLADTARLIIDGVYNYTEAHAQEMYKALPNHRIEAFQSPITAQDIAGMHSLTTAGVPVMASEAEYRHEIHQQLIVDNAVRFLQVSPIACGGLTRLAALAMRIEKQRENTIALSLEVSSTAVALSAACHFAAAFKQVVHTEYHTIHNVFFDNLDFHNVQNRPGWIELADTAGLGISLPPAAVKLEFELGRS